MGVLGHNATFECPTDRRTARARGYRAENGTAPVCPICRKRMALQDTAGFTQAFLDKLERARHD